MTYKTVIAGLLALVAGSLSGCNALISRVGENASEAWVSRVYSAAEAKTLPLDCSKSVDLSAFGNDQFVKVRIPHGRRKVTVIAHVPKGMRVQVEDEVEIEPIRCKNGVMPEVKQVFKS